MGSIPVLSGDQLAPFWNRISFRAGAVLLGKLLFPEPACFLPWEAPLASELAGCGEDGQAHPLARVDTRQTDPAGSVRRAGRFAPGGHC